jgi:hypothetical protein
MTRCADVPPTPEGYLGRVVEDYVHPREVLADDRLSEQEKRSILGFWASDACAVDSRPGFRWLQGTPGPILFDHVIAALRSLDVEETVKGRQYAPRRPQPLQPGL